MALTKTPICDFGKKADNFELKSIDNKIISLNDAKGENGTLIMFICNHCPYVLAVIKNVVEDCEELENDGIKSIAIMSNDPKRYEEDSFDNMIKFSKNHNFNFPYVIDETQEVAKTYGAVCTPDFFGYNKDLELQYRGRIRELKNLKPIERGDSELKNAMKMIAKSNNGPKEQFPSMGCSIKWF
jgi:peroxiredoxin